MEMRHSLRLTQKPMLIMTQRLKQALKLLQAPTLELQQMLKTEMNMNPLLEEVDDMEDLPEADQSETPEAEREREEEEARDTDDKPDEIDWSEFIQDGSDSSTTRSEERQTEFTERVPVSHQSLDEYLQEQIRYLKLTEEEEAIGEFVIGSIDERGYLTMSVEEIAGEVQADPAKVEKVIAAVQSLDPPGIGARDLRECLLLQLRAKGLSGHLVYTVVADHFEDLTHRRQIDIARALRVDVEEVQKCVDLVGLLSPVPGSQISGPVAQYVYPDLIVDRVGDDYVVYLNDKNVPRLRISPAYEHVLNGGKGQDGATKEYVTNKLNSARWLIQTIEQRRKTMVKVMRAIVEEQRDFFEKGILHMKPLTLQDVAGKIGMHESTVSRVTSGKYCQTPRGVFELKFFFSSGLDTRGGEEISAKSAKAIISRLIDGEDKKKPLSDQKIAVTLKAQGLDIARRTVAKYREQLNIPNARFRRRH